MSSAPPHLHGRRLLLLQISLLLALMQTVPGVCSAPAPTPPQIGNGYVATFVNASDVFVAGVFNGVGTNSQRAPLRATTRLFPLAFAYAPEPTVMQLSMDTGVASYVAADSFGSVEIRWYAHRTRKHLLIEEMSLTSQMQSFPSNHTLVNFADDDGGASSSGGFNAATVVLDNMTMELVVPLSLAACARNNTLPPSTFSNPVIPSRSGGGNTTSDWIVKANVSVILYQTRDVEEAAFFGNVSICAVTTLPPPMVSLEGMEGVVKVFTTYCTNAPHDATSMTPSSNPCDCALQRMEEALAVHPCLEAEHAAAWGSLWEHALTVTPATADGPLANLNAVIQGSLYGLLASLRSDVPYSTSPGGLPTNGYRGHTFWDMETWMFPTLALFHPDIALGAAVQYRVDRIQGALNNAAKVVDGANGSAAFPWESAFSGYDVCPWPQGEHSELHVTADVVLAWRMYYYLTLNRTFLSSVFPLLNATSYYWLTRCEKSAATGAWHLDGVTPPDEYHFGNDSVYTNAAVKLAVNFTLEAAAVLDGVVVPLPVAYAAALQDLAEHLVVLYDAAMNYHPEFQGYNGDSQVKQADVILLNFPMGFQPLKPSTAANDLAYYANRTDPLGPAMTWSMFAVGYLSLPAGVVDNATALGLSYFERGYAFNSFPPYYQWYEVAGGSGCPNFLTGAGGFLQSVWAGFLQLRVTGPGALTLLSTAVLPPSLNCTTANGMHFAGSVLRIELCRTASSTTAHEPTSEEEASSYRVTIALTEQGPLVIAANAIPLLKGYEVPFDLVNGPVFMIATAL